MNKRRHRRSGFGPIRHKESTGRPRRAGKDHQYTKEGLAIALGLLAIATTVIAIEAHRSQVEASKVCNLGEGFTTMVDPEEGQLFQSGLPELADNWVRVEGNQITGGDKQGPFLPIPIDADGEAISFQTPSGEEEWLVWPQFNAEGKPMLAVIYQCQEGNRPNGLETG